MSPIDEVIFSHPSVRIQHTGTSNSSSQPLKPVSTQSVTYSDGGYGRGSQLSVGIRPNEFTWSYGLNSQSYPTYAGEVVQILSAYVDNVNVQGDVRTYNDMELIYKWFIAYMTIATQGLKGAPILGQEFRYNETPILMQYPHRSWSMYIRPISLPSFTYGTDVVVPNWQIEAVVVEDENMHLTQMMNSDIPALVQNGLSGLDAQFGLGVENPFNYWNGTYNQGDINKFLGGQTPILNSTSSATQLTDWFHNLVVQNAQGDVDITAINTVYSRPFTQNSDISAQVATQAAGAATSTNAGLGGLAPPVLGQNIVIPKSLTDIGTPAGVVQAALIAYGQKQNYIYDEVTGAQRVYPGGLFGTPPISMDCSGYVTLCFQAAGLPDPNGQNYNPIGNTDSLFVNCTQTNSPAAGDLCFFGSSASASATTHVNLYIGNGQSASMGSPGEPTVGPSEQLGPPGFLGYYHPNVYGA